MDEFDDEVNDKPERPQGEGVRIIGADEAARALEQGQAAGRRPNDAPRFGDVPRRPEGPRPAQRFPLPESVDPAAVRRPPLAESEQQPTPGDEARSAPAAGPAAGPVRPASEPGKGGWPDTGSVEMPHWTEPPTGEVPRILENEEPVSGQEAWSSYAGRGPRWRDSEADWAESDFEGLSLDDAQGRIGALDTSRTEHSDLFSFDEPQAVPEPEPAPPPDPAPTTIRTRREPQPPAPDTSSSSSSDGRDVKMAVGVGAGLLAVSLALFMAGPAFALGLAAVVVTLAAVELYDVLRRAGYRPATLLGLVATFSIMIATYAKGEIAIPLVLGLTTLATFCWYLFGVVQARATVNMAVTLFGFLWVGLLGSFAALLLKFPDREGIAFLLGAVVATVANDVGAWFFGSRMGTRPLMADISPNKTVEGVAGGGATAVMVSLVVLGAFPGVHPWTVGTAALLGLVVWAVGTLGDLCESMVKRDLGIKDMGTLLPGHGGVLDRFDAMLFALPATYYLVKLLNLG